jgi:hypothetical protein
MHDRDRLRLCRHTDIGAHNREVGTALVERPGALSLSVRRDDLEPDRLVLAREILPGGRDQPRILARHRTDRDPQDRGRGNGAPGEGPEPDRQEQGGEVQQCIASQVLALRSRINARQ